MKELFIEALGIYFWVFISVMILKALYMNTGLYKKSKDSRKTHPFNFYPAMVYITFFILSCFY